MRTYVNETFERRSLFVENGRFVRCRFIQCQLIYRAIDQTVFEGCTFEECNWTFGGPAENMLIFLADLYRGLGAEGQLLVESIFEGIRNGTIKQSETIPIATGSALIATRAAG